MFCNCDEAQFELTSTHDDDDDDDDGSGSIEHIFWCGKFTNIAS
jgi:hypothetical protein